MRLLYTKPRLNDLSQGSRIAFARQFRTMSQDEVSDILGLTGECKRRTMTRYEKGDRNPKLHIGICGEHGGDPSSVEFCNKIGLDYVSCSPFRVPIARLAAAQAAIKAGKQN